MTSADRLRGLPEHTKSYVCKHVFDKERTVNYVTRPDGDWCFLCGEDVHPDDASAFRVVGLGHLVSEDGTLTDVLALSPNEEAERPAVGGAWTRSQF